MTDNVNRAYHIKLRHRTHVNASNHMEKCDANTYTNLSVKYMFFKYLFIFNNILIDEVKSISYLIETFQPL